MYALYVFLWLCRCELWNKKQSCSFFDKHHFYLHLSCYKVLQILRVLGNTEMGFCCVMVHVFKSIATAQAFPLPATKLPHGLKTSPLLGKIPPNQKWQTINKLTFYLWLNAVCQINLCLTSLLILDPSASLPPPTSPPLLLSSFPLFCPLSLFHPISFTLSLFLTPFTQMLPAAQLDRSDGMCQIGITPIPTFYTASREAGWVAGWLVAERNICLEKKWSEEVGLGTRTTINTQTSSEGWKMAFSFVR